MKTKTQTQNLLTKKEARQIEMLGEAKNINCYKSQYDLVVMDGQLELDQYCKKTFQIGKSELPIFGRFKFSGSLN